MTLFLLQVGFKWKQIAHESTANKKDCFKVIYIFVVRHIIH